MGLASGASCPQLRRGERSPEVSELPSGSADRERRGVLPASGLPAPRSPSSSPGRGRGTRLRPPSSRGSRSSARGRGLRRPARVTPSGKRPLPLSPALAGGRRPPGCRPQQPPGHPASTVLFQARRLTAWCVTCLQGALCWSSQTPWEDPFPSGLEGRGSAVFPAWAASLLGP